MELLNQSDCVPVAFETLPWRPTHITFRGGRSETLAVWTTATRHGFRTTPKTSADLITLRFVTSGYVSRDNAARRNIVAGCGQGLFSYFEEMRSQMASPMFSAVTATISREVLVRAWRSLNGSDKKPLPRFEIVVDAATQGMIALRSTLSTLQDQMMRDPGASSMMSGLLEELLVYQLLSFWPSSAPPCNAVADAGAHRPIRLAMDYIEANLARRMQIAEIAGAAGVSVRMLQLVFKAHLGCGPVSFLIARRLDQVHAALQACDTESIQQVALRWGFVHMGDLSRRYKERFGCTPTQTRARVARR